MGKSKRFENLPKPVRVALGIGGIMDAVLRAYSLVDLARREPDEVNGPKEVWMPALALVNSLGLLPAAYLKWGRKGRD